MKADFEVKEYRVFATPKCGKRAHQFKKNTLEEAVECKKNLENHGWTKVAVYKTEYMVAYWEKE